MKNSNPSILHWIDNLSPVSRMVGLKIFFIFVFIFYFECRQIDSQPYESQIVTQCLAKCGTNCSEFVFFRCSCLFKRARDVHFARSRQSIMADATVDQKNKSHFKLHRINHMICAHTSWQIFGHRLRRSSARFAMALPAELRQAPTFTVPRNLSFFRCLTSIWLWVKFWKVWGLIVLRNLNKPINSEVFFTFVINRFFLKKFWSWFKGSQTVNLALRISRRQSRCDEKVKFKK